MSQTPEGRVKKMVTKALDSLGPVCSRFMPVQSGFGKKTLDYLCCINGQYVAIETKAPGKKLTPLQEITKAEIEAAGGIVLVVWDEITLQHAMTIIRRLINGQYEHGYRPLNRTAEAPGHKEYVRSLQQAQAADDAAGRHHGTSGEEPR